MFLDSPTLAVLLHLCQVCLCLRGRIVCHVSEQLSEKVKPKKACIFDRKVADRMASPTCRERAQPLGVKITLALRQLRDVTPPGVSPLVEDADIALSLHFYFFTARIPLAAAQVQHLGSPKRLAFGFAPLPRVAKKRPRHFLPFSLADLITRLQQPEHAPPA